MVEINNPDLFIENGNMILYATNDDNREITVKDMYESIQENQLLFLMFFNRWGWIMCRLGAIELTKTYELLEKKYPGIIKVFGFGPDDLGLSEFKELKFFNEPIFVPKLGKEFYKIFEIKKPGFLKCFGFCNKNILNRYSESKKYNTGYTFKGDFSQLGGCFILNKKGKIMYQRYENFLGDHPSRDEIIAKFDEFLKYRKEFEESQEMNNDVVSKYDSESTSKVDKYREQNKVPSSIIIDFQEGEEWYFFSIDLIQK